MPAYQYGSSCYGTPDGAANAAAAAQIGSLVQIGSMTYSTNVLSVGEGVISYQLTSMDGMGSQISVGVPFNSMPCGLLDTADGLVIGWAVAVVWIVTAGVLFLRKGMNL